MLCFALGLSLAAGAAQEVRTEGTIHKEGTGEHVAASELFVHFGIGFGGTKRLLTARVHLGEPFFVAGDDFWQLSGRVDSRRNEIIADLKGSTGSQGGSYRGPVKLGEPFGSQGELEAAASPIYGSRYRRILTRGT